MNPYPEEYLMNDPQLEEARFRVRFAELGWQAQDASTDQLLDLADQVTTMASKLRRLVQPSAAGGCAFCDKIRNEPESLVHVDEVYPVVAFPPRSGGVAPGHLLVVPEAHVASAIERPEITAYTMQVASTLATRLAPCNLIASVGAVATQTVFHLHIHIVPRRPGDGLHLPWTARTS